MRTPTLPEVSRPAAYLAGVSHDLLAGDSRRIASHPELDFEYPMGNGVHMAKVSRSELEKEKLSDGGLLRTGEPNQNLNPEMLALRMREQIDADIAWTNLRRRRFRRRSSTLKGLSLGLTSGSVVILGLQNLSFWASLALGMIGLVTVLNAVEPFANWRARWVVMEETQYELIKVRDRLDFHLLSTDPANLNTASLNEFFNEWQSIWAASTRQWLEHRRVGTSSGS